MTELHPYVADSGLNDVTIHMVIQDALGHFCDVTKTATGWIAHLSSGEAEFTIDGLTRLRDGLGVTSVSVVCRTGGRNDESFEAGELYLKITDRGHV